MKQLEELVEAIHASPFRAVLAITGGGSGAIPSLLTVPGASRTVIEATVPYDEAALAEWIGGAPEQACSEATARRMAMAAFQRARRLTESRDEDARRLVGVGATAALATDRPKKGEHRLHVAAQTASRTLAVRLDLEKGIRSRKEEEAIAAHAVLAVLADAAGVRPIDLGKTPAGITPSLRQAQAAPAVTELLLGVRRSVALAGAGAGLLLPGSFNPPHVGHAEMLDLAEKRAGRQGSFELSITNVDKPPLDFLELEDRLAGLADRPVLLTDAPRFVDKARLAPGCVFAVGADTAVRIGDAAYYGDDPGARDTAIDRLAELGCRFLVFGRMQGGRFRELEDLKLSVALRALCDGFTDEEFRRDISSTEIRSSGDAGGA